MPGPGGPFGDALVAAVRDGRVSEAAVDDKVLRLLRLAARVGALDGRRDARGRRGADVVGRGGRRPSCAAAAAASFVLARNHGSLLPLEGGSLRRVAVLGPNAAVARTLGGGSATVFPTYTVSPLEGLRARARRRVHATRRASAPTRGCRSPTSRPPTSASSPPTAPCSAPSTARSASSPGSGRSIRPSRRSRSTRRCGPSAAGEYVVGCSGPGRFQLSLRGEPGRSTSCSSCARTPTPARRCSRRRSTACR